MSVKGFISFFGIMGSLFFITVAYNACSNETAFIAESGFDQVDLRSEDGDQAVATLDGPSPGIVINGDAAFTKSKDVNLSLSTGIPMSEMLVSNNKDCASGVWEKFQGNRAWKLPYSNRKLGVYVQYRNDPEDDPTPCVEDTIIHDDLPPVVDVSHGIQNGWVGEPNLEIRHTTIDALSGVRETLCSEGVGKAYKNCSGPKKYERLEENKSYSFFIRATDLAGNMSPKVATHWEVDLTPPKVSFNQRPAAITADVNPILSFIGLDAGSGVKAYDCILDAAPTYTACSNVQTLSGLADGAHTLTVRAIDHVGHISQPVEHTWVQDTKAPTVRFTSTPAPLTNSPTAQFGFQGLDGSVPLVQYQCRVDTGNWTACSSPFTQNGLSDGTHSFSVIGQDRAGNKSAALTYAWEIDTGLPTLSFIDTPDKLTKDVQATFQVRAVDNVGGSGIAKIQCQLDSAPYQDCNTSFQFDGLSSRSHRVNVRGTDRAGNVSVPVGYTWVVDSIKPTVLITSAPADPTNATVGNFEFTGTDSGSGIQSYSCRIDGASFKNCDSPKAFLDLKEGTHTFTVTATDKAGNVSLAKTHQWTIDRTGPVISFVKQPGETIIVGDMAPILFSIQDASGVGSHTCSLTGQSQSCSIGVELQIPSSEEKNFSFSIVALDSVGNATTETITWRSTYKMVDKMATFTVDGDKPVDILFVVDDSGSMNYERSSLAQRIQGLLAKLEDLDWQISVISTDVRTTRPFDGNLIEIIGAPGQYVLDQSMNLDTAQTLLGETIQNFSGGGSGAEQGIWATKRAIDRYVNGSASHRQFFREGASLSVVLLSDEDENSKGTDIKMQPQDFLDFVGQTWNGEKNLTWHSIIARPDDTACLGSQAGGNHYAGHKYMELSVLTGYEDPALRGPASAGSGGAIIGSVCETDYTSQLADIGQSVRDTQKTVALECIPASGAALDVAYKDEGLGDFVDYSEPFQVQGQKLIFEDFLPSGEFKVNYSCVDI